MIEQKAALPGWLFILILVAAIATAVGWWLLPLALIAVVISRLSNAAKAAALLFIGMCVISALVP